MLSINIYMREKIIVHSEIKIDNTIMMLQTVQQNIRL